jgi:pilus assembly protein Flp/PilA
MKTALTIRRRFLRLGRDERGATLVEYLILVGLVAIAAFAAFQIFGQDIKTVITGQGNTVNTIPQNP